MKGCYILTISYTRQDICNNLLCHSFWQLCLHSLRYYENTVFWALGGPLILTEVIVWIRVPVVVEPECAEAALDADGAGAQEGVGRLAHTQPTHLVVHVCKYHGFYK